MPSRKDDMDLGTALATISERMRLQAVQPNIYRYTPHSKQKEFHSNPKKCRLFVAGNRSGKSLASVVEGIWYLTGTHPYRETPPLPVRGRVVGVDFLNGIDKIILPLYKQWLPPEYLVDGLWEKSYNAERHVLTLKNGSFVEFMSQDQDLDKFAGTSRHFVHFDEECPKLIFEECSMRLIDTDGDWWISETPVAGMEWIYDDLYEPTIEGTRDDIGLIEASTHDNTYLKKSAIDRLMAMFPEEERLMREQGQYTTVTGALFKKFKDKAISDGGNILPNWHPKLDQDPQWSNCRIYITGDHGFNNPTAWLWVAVNTWGECRVFHQWFEKEMTVAQHAAEITRYNKEWDIEPYLICGDPAMGQRSGLTGDSVLAEYSRHGIEIQTKGITRDRQVGLNKINQYFETNPRTGIPFLTVTTDCVDVRREFKGAKAARIVNKLVASRKNAPEGIREKDDHSIDSVRYLLTLLPDLTYKDLVGQGEQRWSDNPYGFQSMPVYDGYDHRNRGDWAGWSHLNDSTVGLE